MLSSSDSSPSDVDWVGQIDPYDDDESDDKAGDKDMPLQPSTSNFHQELDPLTKANSRKRKWDVKFNKEWCKKYPNIIQGSSVSRAKCLACGSQFGINHGGENDISKHMKTEKHKKIISDTSGVKKLDNFLTDSRNELATIHAECSFVFHSVKHSHSYASTDCGGKLFRTIFCDSKIAEKYSCGRTKATQLITKVLGPETKNKILKDLANNKPFSIATDASNKGNIKLFPFIVRYFNKESGINTKLLNFYSSDSEKSKDIAQSLIDHLDESGLSILNVIAYCADNASVNFGKNQSVFTELRKRNENIVPVGCVCHIIHNAGKHGQVALKYDVESLVIKCFNEFSSSTKKVMELKDFFTFCDEEWSELLRSVPTRWLSLVPAVERFLKHFAPVKAYFLSQEMQPAMLKKFLEDELAEAYLGNYFKILFVIFYLYLPLCHFKDSFYMWDT